MATHNVLPITGLDHERFTWHKESSTLVVDASDLAGWFGPQRLWNDACDLGIAIIGRTRTERFYLENEIKDEAGEITGWTFAPINKDCHVKHVTIIND